MQVSIDLVRQRWPEKAGFHLNRPTGAGCYILLHFLTPVTLHFAGQSVAAAPGSLIVFAPGTGHGFDSAVPLVHDWMHLTGDVDALMGEYGLAPDTLYQPGVSATISEITGLLEAEFFARRPLWQPLAEVKLRELFIRTAQSLQDTPARMLVSPESAEALRRLRASMLAAPEKDWPVQEMAGALNVSTSRFYALYREFFSIAPRQDLILMRVEKAKALLWQNTSVTETAAQLGYASVYHFIRQFRQVTGISPKQYVRQR